jgi:hypothetical protein
VGFKLMGSSHGLAAHLARPRWVNLSRELHGITRCPHLETVKFSPAYWPLKVRIGTAVANTFWTVHPTVLSQSQQSRKASATIEVSPKGLSLLSRGRVVNETRHTEIPSSSGMGSLDSNSAHRFNSANCTRHVEVLLRASGQAVSSSGFPTNPRRQVASDP